MNKERITIEINLVTMKFIENIARFYEVYGIPRIGGRMFGLFLVTAVPLSAEKIAELLNASRSSISTNVRGLIANGWVEKVTFPGDRTEYFQFCPMAWENVLENRKKGLAPLLRMAEQAQADLTIDAPAREQLKGMSEWVKLQIKSHEAMIAAWREIQANNLNS
jgi:DNA-binding transcriptional regulator GbsR (MarR family)